MLSWQWSQYFVILLIKGLHTFTINMPISHAIMFMLIYIYIMLCYYVHMLLSVIVIQNLPYFIKNTINNHTKYQTM